MTECGRLSDRIPGVVLGMAKWTPEEARHLNDCRLCQEELGLIRMASRLGDTAAGSIDSSAMASAVLRRLTHQREVGGRRRRWSFAGLAAAAGIAAAVWAGSADRVAPLAPSGTVVAGRLAIPLPELETLHAAELDSVLQTMDEPNVSGVLVDEPGLGDLNFDELETVLDSWEG